MENHPELINALCKIMAGVSAVKKDGKNEFQKYKYAKAEDVLHSLKGLMAENGIYVHHTEDRQSENDGGVLSIWFNFTIYHTSGASLPPTTQCGMAACRNSKGGFDDKAASKCLTAAMKYFLINTFKIPTGDHDDADNDDVEKNERNAKVQAKKPDAAPTPSIKDNMIKALEGAPDAPKLLKIFNSAAFTEDFHKLSGDDQAEVKNVFDKKEQSFLVEAA